MLGKPGPSSFEQLFVDMAVGDKIPLAVEKEREKLSSKDRLRLVAVGSAHRHRLRLVTSATWPSALLVAVGSASWPSLAPCGRRLCLVAVGSARRCRLCPVASATRPSAPPRGRRLRLAAVGSASWPWASLDSFCLVAIDLMTVGFSSSPPPCHPRHVAVGSACCRQLRLVAVASALWSSALPRGLRSSLLPLPRRLRLAAVGSALWPWAPLDLFCLVAIGLVIVDFGSLPPPRGVGSACGRGLHLVAIGSASWRGLYS
ncbi:hypothetical protein NL676_019013 [Syzygium grande]|nr:hypothetical protein NL676_019013 [Syzygium grande]